MQTWTKVLLMLMRLTWLVGLILGLYIWTSHGYSVLKPHIALGFTSALLLMLILLTGIAAKAKPIHILLAAVWVVLLPVIGFGQLHWLPGANHWLIRVVHLLIGLFAIGSAEMIGAHAARSQAR